MVITPARLSAVIAQVYAAIGSRDGFYAALRGIRDFIGGSSGMLFTPLVDPGSGGFAFVDHVNPDFFARYRAYSGTRPWAKEAERKGLLRTASTFTDEALISQHALRKEEIYPNLMVPMDATRLCCSVIMRDEDPALPRTYLSIFRGARSRPFSEYERHALELVGPHVLEALRLAYRLEFAKTSHASACDALHEVDRGVILVDVDKNVVFMNRSAERLCNRERGVTAVKQLSGACVLRANFAREEALLQKAIDAAIQPPALGQSAAGPGSVAIHGLNGHGPILATALALPANRDQTGRAVVFLEDSATSSSAPDLSVLKLFGVTPAERRVAEALLAGEPPKVVAERLALTENTIRTHIKALYAKSGARGMAALMTLLGRLAASRACGTHLS